MMFKICERMLKLCQAAADADGLVQYSDMENFTKAFIAYKYDVKGGKMAVGQYNHNGQKSESNMTTRRSSNR